MVNLKWNQVVSLNWNWVVNITGISNQKIVDSFKSNKVNDTTGIQFGAYLTGFGILCFIILLVWIGWQFKAKKKSSGII